jgi:hypothetical protein
MARYSFTATYTDVEQKLLRERQRTEYLVLRVLAQHANSVGVCWPGPRRIAEIAGYAESTVIAALVMLEAWGYLRARRNPRGYDYQLSPDVVWIRDELETEARALWAAESTPITELFNADVMQVVTEYTQPAEPDENQLQNQLQTKSKPPPAEKPKTGKRGKKSAATPANGAKPEEQTDDSHSANGAASAAGTPPSANGATPQRDLSRFRRALPGEDAERLARNIAAGVGTRITQARAMVAEYDMIRCTAVLNYVMQERRINPGNVQRPAALMTWLLRNWSDEDGAPAGEESLDERYREFVES